MAMQDGSVAAGKGGVHDAALAHLMELSGAAYQLAMRILGSAEAAEDAVQQAYLNALHQLRFGSPPAEPRTWFLRVTANAAKDLRRTEARRKRREEVVASQVARVGVGAGNDTTSVLKGAVASLEEKYRVPVSLCCEQGLSQRQAALVLELPERTVSDHVRIGLEKLRRALERAGYPAAVTAVLGALRETAPEVPASLGARVEALVTGTAAVPGGGAIPAAAVKGGLAMKALAVIVLAGAATAGAVMLGGGRTGTLPAEASGKKFSTPIWHPDAEWESAGRFLGSVMPANGAGWLDGPKQEMMCRERHPGPWGASYGSHERCVWACLDEETGRYHAVAGAEVHGYLDGPFSRARHGGWTYMDRAFGMRTPDRRYLYTSDKFNGMMIRRLDFEKQEITTVEWAVKNFTGLTMGVDGKIYALCPPHLAVLDQDGKLERKIELEMKGKVGWEAKMAHDPKRNRMWATSGHNPERQWHVWYWDLKDGSFHGEVPAKPKQPGDPMFGGLPVSYENGWFVYPQSRVYFGPDDPDYRFLYMCHTDCGNSHRLDLEKKEIWVMSGPPRNKGGPVRYVFKREQINPFEPHTGPGWQPNGDFTIPVGGSAGLGTVLYKRVK